MALPVKRLRFLLLLVILALASLVQRIGDHDEVAITNKETVAQEKPPNKVFISAKFGRDSMFAEQVARYRTQVEATGIFDADRIHTYADFPDWVMKDPRWSNHLMFLDKPKHSSKVGGGYWFWKAVLIGHHLDELNDGDCIVYSDSDLLSRMLAHRYLLLLFCQLGKAVIK
jgi:hypothetical protein